MTSHCFELMKSQKKEQKSAKGSGKIQRDLISRINRKTNWKWLFLCHLGVVALARHIRLQIMRVSYLVGRNRHSNRHTPPKGSARCVQSFDDSLDSAIRITYRISLRSSSLWEPRHPSLKVLWRYVLYGFGVLMINNPYRPAFHGSSQIWKKRLKIYRGFEDPERPKQITPLDLSSGSFSTV